MKPPRNARLPTWAANQLASCSATPLCSPHHIPLVELAIGRGRQGQLAALRQGGRPLELSAADAPFLAAIATLAETLAVAGFRAQDIPVGMAALRGVANCWVGLSIQSSRHR